MSAIRRALGACGLLAIGALGCTRKDPPPPAPGPAADDEAQCFETHGRTSAAASAVFEKRHLQGGGPTWAALLEVIVRRHADVGATWAEPSPVGFGDAHDATFRGARTWYVIDDEAEGAVFCAGTPAFLHVVDDEVTTLNADTASLEQAIDQADPRWLE
jgi:hypothetical protein